MADEKTVKIIIEAQSKVDAATKDVKTKLEGLKGSVDNMQPAFRKMAAVGTVAFTAISAIAVTSFKAFADAQAQTVITNKSLENSLNSMQGNALKKLQKELGTSTDAIGALKKHAEEAGKAALKMGFDDEEAARSFAKLFGITKNVAQANKELAVAQDLARFKGISLEDATQKLVLVHAGATKELKAMGLAVDKDATALQNIDSITKQVTGSTEAFAKTEEGAMQIIKVNSDNLKESIGAGLAPAFQMLREKLVPVVQKFADWAEKNPETISQIFLIGGGVTALVAGLGFLGMALPGIIKGFRLMATTIKFLTTSAFGPWLVVLAAVAAAYVLINNSIQKFQSLLESNAQSIAEQQGQQQKIDTIIAGKKAKGLDTSALESANAQAKFGTSELQRYQESSFLGKVFFKEKTQAQEPRPLSDTMLSADQVNSRAMMYNITFNGDITDKNEFLKKLKDSMSQVLQVKTVMP